MLLWVPDMVFYRGASGFSAMMMVLAAAALCRYSRRLQILLTVLGAMLLSKIWIDATGFIQMASSLPDGVHLAWQTHILGAVTGISMVAYLAFKHRAAQFGVKDSVLVQPSVDLDSSFVVWRK
jgi:membrane associated rhomboid family serine protease